MDADESDIVNYLSSWPDQFLSAVEICRRAAGKGRFREDPNWAVRVLNRLVEKKLIVTDAAGHFRIAAPPVPPASPAPPVAAPDKPAQEAPAKPKRWMAPHIRKILEQSGKKFDDVHEPRQGHGE